MLTWNSEVCGREKIEDWKFSLKLEHVPSTSPCFLFLSSYLTCRLSPISSLGVIWLGVVVGTVMYLPGLASHTSLTLWITSYFFWQDFDQAGCFHLQFAHFGIRVSREAWQSFLACVLPQAVHWVGAWQVHAWCPNIAHLYHWTTDVVRRAGSTSCKVYPKITPFSIRRFACSEMVRSRWRDVTDFWSSLAFLNQ